MSDYEDDYYDDYYDDYDDGPAPVRSIDSFHSETGANLTAGLWLPMRYAAGDQILAFIDGFEALELPSGWSLCTNGDYTRFEDEYAEGGYVDWMIGRPILRAYANDCGPVGGIPRTKIIEEVRRVHEELTPELRDTLFALTPEHATIDAEAWRARPVGAHVIPYGPLAGGHLLWGYLGERGSQPPEGLRRWRAVNMRQNPYGEPVHGVRVAGGHDWDVEQFDTEASLAAQAERENLAQTQPDQRFGFWLVATYD